MDNKETHQYIEAQISRYGIPEWVNPKIYKDELYQYDKERGILFFDNDWRMVYFNSDGTIAIRYRKIFKSKNKPDLETMIVFSI